MKCIGVSITLLAVAVFAGLGCEEPAKSGVVMSHLDGGLQPGLTAPDIKFMSFTGKESSLKAVTQPITILAFTEAPGEACCLLQPQLVQLTQRFEDLPISIVQVSEPTGKCPHGPGCVETCQFKEMDLITLCDTDRKAWMDFAQPQKNTVYLIDEIGNVVDIAPLSNMKELVESAEYMGNSVKRRYGDEYQQIWTY